MPHIFSNVAGVSPKLPYSDGVFTIHNYCKNERYEIFLVTQDGLDFTLSRKNKSGRSLIKYDKPTRPASTKLLGAAIQNLAIALNCRIDSTNISDAMRVEQPHNPKLLRPDFFIQNQDFLKNKQAQLEIGFGSGRHLLAIAKAQPDKIFFGVEIYKPAVDQMFRRIAHEGIDNIFVVDFDARLFLQTMPSSSLEKIYIHFPVPWNDAPHRRVFGKKFVEEAFRVLCKDGALELRSDDDIYFEDACKVSLEFEAADFHVYKNKDAVVSSKYEDRWKKQGKNIYDLVLKALKNQNDSKIEYNFDLNEPLKISMLQKLVGKPAEVFDGILVRFEDVFLADDGAFLLKVILGSVDMPESKYIYTSGNYSGFYPTKPLAIMDNLRAFNKLQEMVYGKSNHS